MPGWPSPVSAKGYNHSGGQEASEAAGNSSPSKYDKVVISKNTEIFSSHVIPMKAEIAYTGERINVMIQVM